VGMIKLEVILKLVLLYGLKRVINLKVLNLSNNIVETVKIIEQLLVI